MLQRIAIFFFFSSFDIWKSNLLYWDSVWVSEYASCHKTCSGKTGSIRTSCRNRFSLSATVQQLKWIGKEEKEIAAPYDLEHQNDHRKTCSKCIRAHLCVLFVVYHGARVYRAVVKIPLVFFPLFVKFCFQFSVCSSSVTKYGRICDHSGPISLHWECIT